MTELWFAPEAWRDAKGGERQYLCYFQFKAAVANDGIEDRFWLSALTGAGVGKAGLYVVSDRLGDARLRKLFAADAALIERLQGQGFVYDVAGGRALSMSITVDREQLIADLRNDDVDTALEPFRRALATASASASLLDPIVSRVRAATGA